MATQGEILLWLGCAAASMLGFWIWFGPKPCPRCGRRIWGLPGPHLSARRTRFVCPWCGHRSSERSRPPV